MARKLIENNEDIAFSYADINCRCKLRFKNNDEFFFESLDVLAIQMTQTSEFVFSMVIVLILSHPCVTIISF